MRICDADAQLARLCNARDELSGALGGHAYSLLPRVDLYRAIERTSRVPQQSREGFLVVQGRRDAVALDGLDRLGL